jgi:hypothetical protein
MTREMTKAELIKAIERKVAKAKPILRNDFIGSLKYKNKPTLARYLKNARVDKDGYGIRVG